MFIKNKKGFTLLQVMIGLILTMTIMGPVLKMMHTSSRQVNQAIMKTKLQMGSTTLLELISRDLRAAQRIIKVTPSAIRFWTVMKPFKDQSLEKTGFFKNLKTTIRPILYTFEVTYKLNSNRTMTKQVRRFQAGKFEHENLDAYINNTPGTIIEVEKRPTVFNINNISNGNIFTPLKYNKITARLDKMPQWNKSGWDIKNKSHRKYIYMPEKAMDSSGASLVRETLDGFKITLSMMNLEYLNKQKKSKSFVDLDLKGGQDAKQKQITLSTIVIPRGLHNWKKQPLWNPNRY